jgi:hypothetical protein
VNERKVREGEKELMGESEKTARCTRVEGELKLCSEQPQEGGLSTMTMSVSLLRLCLQEHIALTPLKAALIYEGIRAVVMGRWLRPTPRFPQAQKDTSITGFQIWAGQEPGSPGTQIFRP